jgi:hypothetical protein
MRIFLTVLFCLPTVALAQEDISDEELLKASAPKAPAPEPTERLPEIGEDQLQVFVLERGFYVTGDLGMSLSLGGTRGNSNVQPFWAVRGGWDINDWLGVQGYLSGFYVSENPASEADEFGAGGNQTMNFSANNFGVETVFLVRVATRLALEPHVGFGASFLNPALTDPGDVSSSLGTTQPHVTFGVDIKYLTLLTDFIAGIAINTYYLPGPGVFAIAPAVVVRYTF